MKVHSTEVTNEVVERVEVTGTDVIEKGTLDVPMLKEKAGIIPRFASAKEVNHVTEVILERHNEMNSKINEGEYEIQKTLLVLDKIKKRACWRDCVIGVLGLAQIVTFVLLFV